MEENQGKRGPALIFIHDWFIVAGDDWAAQINYFSEYYRCLTFSLIGHGGEGESSLQRESLIAANMDRLNQLIEDLGDNVRIIAHGVSCQLALRAALSHPKRVRSLVLISPMVLPRPSRLARLAGRFSFLVPLYLLFHDPIGDTHLPPWVRLQRRHRALSFGYAGRYLKDFSVPPSQWLFDSISAVTANVCIISGEKDPLGCSQDAEKINRVLKQSHLFRYSSLHHSPHREDPAMVNHVVHHFLKKSDGIIGRGLEQLRGFIRNIFGKERSENY